MLSAMVFGTILVTRVGIFVPGLSRSLRRARSRIRDVPLPFSMHSFGYTLKSLTLATPRVSGSELLRTHYRMAAAGPTSYVSQNSWPGASIILSEMSHPKATQMHGRP